MESGIKDYESENRNFFLQFLSLGVIFFAGIIIFEGRGVSVFKPKPRVLQATSVNTNEVRFYYDAGGQRIAKIDPSEKGVNTYYLSPELEVVVDKTGNTKWRKNYYYAGKAIAVKLSEDNSVVPTATPTFIPTPTTSQSQYGNLVSGGKSVTASSTYSGTSPSNVVDGSISTAWNSGRVAPGWVEIDLGSERAVRNIRLNVRQTPNGATVHRIYAGTTRTAMTQVREVSGTTTSGQWLLAQFTTPLARVRYVRVETASSPSWVSWGEIEVYE